MKISGSMVLWLVYFILLDEQQTVTMEGTRRVSTSTQKWNTNTCAAVATAALGISLLLVMYFPATSKTEIENVVKDHYRKLNEIDLDQYLPKSMNPKKIHFISPTFKIVNDSCSAISVEKLLESVETQGSARLAVIGKPGIGKSTLVRHIAKLWAKKLHLQSIEVLFHICLGKASTPITEMKHLLKEECHVTGFDPSKVQELIDWTVAHRGEGVVFILDGFDEYFLRNAEDENDFLFRLMKSIDLPKASVIATLRPSRLEHYKDYFTKLVRMVGFSQKDIEVSLLHLEPPLRHAIRKYFESNTNIRKMSYFPLHMTMIIHLASLKEYALTDIDSRHMIFTRFLDLIINHYNQSSELGTFSLDYCLKDPAAFYSLCSHVALVSELAFNSTIQKMQTFSLNEISSTYEELRPFSIKRERRRSNGVDEFAFTHPTIQEFMSAFHLAMLPTFEQKNMITKYKKDLAFKDLIWAFFFDLVGEKKAKKLLGKNMWRGTV